MKLIFSLLLLYSILYVKCSPLTAGPPTGKLTTEENYLLQNTCGHYDEKAIVKSIDSKRVHRNEAPWVVAVSRLSDITSNKDNSTSPRCSGTLISPRHVLAAKHCLLQPKAESIWVEVPEAWLDGFPGRTIISNDTKPVYLVETFMPREEALRLKDVRFVFDNECGADNTLYGKTPCSTKNAIVRKAVRAFSPNLRLLEFSIGKSDLLIFELNEPVEIGRNLYPACLSDRIPQDKEVFDLYSFGSDEKKDNTSFLGTLQHISVTKVPCLALKSRDVVCTRSSTNSVANGDSGGGFILKNNGTSYVTAVVSGHYPVTTNYNDAGQVAVAPHLHWICEHVGICVDTKEAQIRPEIEIIVKQ